MNHVAALSCCRIRPRIMQQRCRVVGLDHESCSNVVVLKDYNVIKAETWPRRSVPKQNAACSSLGSSSDAV